MTFRIPESYGNAGIGPQLEFELRAVATKVASEAEVARSGWAVIAALAYREQVQAMGTLLTEIMYATQVDADKETVNSLFEQLVKINDLARAGLKVGSVL